MTRNQKLHVLHVDSAQAFAEGQAVQYVSGDTLLFDFVYFLHPVRPALLPMISCTAANCPLLSLTGLGSA